MASVEVRNLSRSFGTHKALDNVSIRFDDGGFYALLGPSGSGKTTLLRMIAGFDFPDAGSIEMDGESVERVPLEKRQIGMVFQNYALFPNMSVTQNIAFGLDVRRLKREETASKVQAALDLVQLGTLGARRPHQLSGGQRQRVALARAFVINPRVLLLDEPLGALDKALRVDMQVELKRIQREIGITTIFVTHDQEEALTMSDRIGILKDGKVIEEGRPGEIYNKPKSLFAATFLGDANVLSGVWNGNELVLPDGTAIRIGDTSGLNGRDQIQCAIRPERIHILRDNAAPLDNVMHGKMARHIFAGANSTLTVECGETTLRVLVPNAGVDLLPDGTDITLTWSSDSTIFVRQDV
jgi:spermidine/putrescine ABC transporter ATP-binding subunit